MLDVLDIRCKLGKRAHSNLQGCHQGCHACISTLSKCKEVASPAEYSLISSLGNMIGWPHVELLLSLLRVSWAIPKSARACAAVQFIFQKYLIVRGQFCLGSSFRYGDEQACFSRSGSPDIQHGIHTIAQTSRCRQHIQMSAGFKFSLSFSLIGALARVSEVQTTYKDSQFYTPAAH